MWWTTTMLVIMASCVFMYVTTPHFSCMATENHVCDDLPMGSLTWVYARSMSVACFVSYLVVWVKYRGGIAQYGARIAVHDTYSPTTGEDRRKHATFNAAVVFTCALLVLPANGTRLFTLHAGGRSAEVLAFYGLMYAQNVLMCLLETRFVLQCYVLFTKFVRINRDMEAIGDQIGARCGGGGGRQAGDRGSCWTLDGGDMYRSRTTGQLLVDAIEELKIRHRLIREAVDELHDVFAVPMGFSLCNLCIMALYDVYHQLLNVYVRHTVAHSNLFIVAWLTQYSFRFFIVVIMVHSTMQQALRSKESITRVRRNCLDVYTKEELQIFSDQVSSIMEFSICGLFTLNSQLFTSAVGVGTTYLVILLQLKSKLDNDGL